jgi:hypothetical protein
MQIFFFSFVAMILSGYEPKTKKQKIKTKWLQKWAFHFQFQNLSKILQCIFSIAEEGIPLLILKILKKIAMYFLDCRSKHSTFNF